MVQTQRVGVAAPWRPFSIRRCPQAEYCRGKSKVLCAVKRKSKLTALIRDAAVSSKHSFAVCALITHAITDHIKELWLHTLPTLYTCSLPPPRITCMYFYVPIHSSHVLYTCCYRIASPIPMYSIVLCMQWVLHLGLTEYRTYVLIEPYILVFFHRLYPCCRYVEM